MAATERKSDFKLTTDTQYLALTGELYGIYHVNFEKKYDHVITAPHCILKIGHWQNISLSARFSEK